MYKLIALDIDGTLLNREHEIADETIDVIKESMDKGIKVILVSGRDYSAAESYIKKIETKDLFLGLNGANIYDNKGEIIHSEYLDKEIVEYIIELSEKEEIYIVLFIGKNTYVDKASNFMGIDNYVFNSIEVGQISKFHKEQNVTKILLTHKEEKLIPIKEKLDSKYGSKINSQFSLPQFLEIFNGEINKGVALKRICEKYKISKEKVMAIGDWDNDITMIKYAGLGVAMGNGSENIKEAADFITKSNEENGAAYAIKKFVLKK
ncbi:Cof-type HAD-IIB family hydrolase [Clostridium tetani]|uniref:HAD family hydrolase n=1 Tax=Clostridium tetani TaxID=1513 RepID=UPI00100BCF8B|nr:HAD family hydrolase [Clostridium tetani]RXI38447.1 Cof-type HAD-IIB family hydrolase [Clostridium tetani]